MRAQEHARIGAKTTQSFPPEGSEETAIDYTDQGLIFDRPDYLASLPHLGTALSLPGVPFGLLRRPIFATGSFDLMGGWPYCSAPPAENLPDICRALTSSGAVSFLAILPPGVALTAHGASDTFAVRPLKPHFVFDPARPATPLSAKARSNLRQAERHWRLEHAAPPTETAPLAARLYRELAERRQISAIATMPPGHFETLLALEGIETIAIRGADGRLGGVVIAACLPDRADMLHLLAAERAMTSNGSYLLMQAACDIWGRERPLFMGGVPDSASAAGVGKFKRRWANHEAGVSLLTAVLDASRYRDLAGRYGAPNFFPAYRHPDGTAHARNVETVDA